MGQQRSLRAHIRVYERRRKLPAGARELFSEDGEKLSGVLPTSLATKSSDIHHAGFDKLSQRQALAELAEANA